MRTTNLIEWLSIHNYPRHILMWRLECIGFSCILQFKLPEKNSTYIVFHFPTQQTRKREGICIFLVNKITELHASCASATYRKIGGAKSSELVQNDMTNKQLCQKDLNLIPTWWLSHPSPLRNCCIIYKLPWSIVNISSLQSDHVPHFRNKIIHYERSNLQCSTHQRDLPYSYYYHT